MLETVDNGFGSLVAKVAGREGNLTIGLKKDFCDLCDIKKDDIVQIEIIKIKRVKRK